MESSAELIDFGNRLRRSQGRSGRTFAATAKVTEQERATLEEAAKAEGKALSEWARETLLRAAGRTSEDAVFTEGIATRMLMLELLRPLLKQAGVGNEMISEVMAGVKREKHRTAREVMTQYMRTEEE